MCTKPCAGAGKKKNRKRIIKAFEEPCSLNLSIYFKKRSFQVYLKRCLCTLLLSRALPARLLNPDSCRPFEEGSGVSVLSPGTRLVSDQVCAAPPPPQSLSCSPAAHGLAAPPCGCDQSWHPLSGPPSPGLWALAQSGS